MISALPGSGPFATLGRRLLRLKNWGRDLARPGTPLVIVGRPNSGDFPVHEPLILIGPRSVTGRVARFSGLNRRVVVFRSLEELDRWRSRGASDAIRADVE
jgi:hypothetical protein